VKDNILRLNKLTAKGWHNYGIFSGACIDAKVKIYYNFLKNKILVLQRIEAIRPIFGHSSATMATIRL
jgi:hypothetical protein